MLSIFRSLRLTFLQIRNLSRLVWINVAVPPADDTTKGKGPAGLMSAKELRRKKVQTIKLCVCFAFAVKHYLRGEDGLDWDDYIGILPPTVAKLAKPGASRKTSAWTSYNATQQASPEHSGTSSRDEQADDEHDGSPVRSGSLDATKRIRVKRSKERMKPGVKSPSTPLLNAIHQTIDFNPDPDNLTTPLPLVCVHMLH